MTGRGIDQALPHPGNPILYEEYMKSARGYVSLAEAASGRIPAPVDFAYIWGDALEEMERVVPDLRIINLETTITRSETYLKDKGIHYRMNPENISCITAAKIDCCCLANNHMLDWGCSGLLETLATLDGAGVKRAGAGRNLKEAQAPAILDVEDKGRALVFSFGSETSGIPEDWAASDNKPGVNLLRDFSTETADRIGELVRGVKENGDIVVFSVHWGANWGYEISHQQMEFAHRIIDSAAVDIIHGHSSHHFKGIEVYKDKPILYGCGDFLNDYEGISGYEVYRGDLGLMYFVTFNPETAKLAGLEMIPTQVRLFRVNRASAADFPWIITTLNREGQRFGTRVEQQEDALVLKWR
ncbi:MAG: CapA family protein [Chloroflexi bacterium]|nr:CapA family protein [Chloroflexota bacterium]